ncbi:MAG TPA: DUF3109 family protein [Kofleriaceae bacterium]|jgi:Fe-S-cluster containining protein
MDDEPTIAIEHPRFRFAWTGLFTKRIVADCMTHECSMIEKHGLVEHDICCQYGADVDLAEKTQIEAHEADIRPLLRGPAAELPVAEWFEPEVYVDADYPSGAVVRTAVSGRGCVFLSHDARGCAIHRAALEQRWDLRGVKPAICRLFPLSYEGDTIMVAGEYAEYSCAHVDGPTIYRYTRDIVGELFGAALVAALDAAEAKILAAAPKRLPVLA